MKKQQIDHVLDLLNKYCIDKYSLNDTAIVYGPDLWLDADEIALIALSTDENVYPDNTCQIYFDSGNELLKTRLVKKRKEGTPIILQEPYQITHYTNITAIQLANHAHTKYPYKKGAMV